MLKCAVHPGEILRDELAWLGFSPSEFAREIGMPSERIDEIIAGRRAVLVDDASRFGNWFDIDPQFWLNLQTQFDLAAADLQT